MDKATLDKIAQDQLELLKKVAKDLALAEALLLVPEIIDVLNSLLPEAVKPLVVGIESTFVPQAEEALKKLIESKLA